MQMLRRANRPARRAGQRLRSPGARRPLEPQQRARVLRRANRSLWLALIAASLAGTASADSLPTQTWSFDGPFGGLDYAAAQRGFQVYKEVCSNCHSMNFLHYRGPDGHRAVGGSASGQLRPTYTVPHGPRRHRSGQRAARRCPEDPFKLALPEPDLAARAAQQWRAAAGPVGDHLCARGRTGLRLSPDRSTGYEDPPADTKVGDGPLLQQMVHRTVRSPCRRRCRPMHAVTYSRRDESDAGPGSA